MKCFFLSSSFSRSPIILPILRLRPDVRFVSSLNMNHPISLSLRNSKIWDLRNYSLISKYKKNVKDDKETSPMQPIMEYYIHHHHPHHYLSSSEFMKSKFGKKEFLRIMRTNLWPQNDVKTKLNICFSLGMLLSAKLLAVQIPFFLKRAIDGIKIPSPSPASLATSSSSSSSLKSLKSLAADRKEVFLYIPSGWILSYGAAKAGSALFHELRYSLFSKVAMRSIINVASSSFFHLHGLDLDFHMGTQTGGIARAIDRGIRGITYCLNAFISHLIPTVFEVFVVCGVMFYRVGTQYSIITGTTVSVYVLWTLLLTHWRAKFRHRVIELENEAASITVDSLINYTTVKFFNNEQFELNRYQNTLGEFKIASQRAHRSLALLNFGQNFIFALSITLCLFLGAKDVVSGRMTLGDLVMLNSMLFQLSSPLSFLGSTYREINQAIVDMGALVYLQSLQSSFKDGNLVLESEAVNARRISFEDVFFSYDDSKTYILNGVSFDVPAGKTVAIVGATGCGKSTLMKLMFRFYDPNKGSILIDDINIKDLTLESLRSSLGVIPQDPVLFDETIYFNIAYGNPNASKENVIEAAKVAGIHENIVLMENGYETEVGERGLKLSSGEKQRIAIARVILKEPDILICDEITSNLDSRTERLILNRVKAFQKGRTCIIIAHRLSTIIDCDEIIVMGEFGHIVERGSALELFELKGEFFRLWQRQTMKALNLEPPLPSNLSNTTTTTTNISSSSS